MGCLYDGGQTLNKLLNWLSPSRGNMIGQQSWKILELLDIRFHLVVL